MPQSTSRIQNAIATTLTVGVVALGAVLLITNPDAFIPTRVNYVCVHQPQQEAPQQPPVVFPAAVPMGVMPEIYVQNIPPYGNVICINHPCPHRPITIPVQGGQLYHYVRFNDGVLRKIFVRQGQACYVVGNEHYNINFPAIM